ncbi:long tail fiber protein distal subunit [Pectobacterium bacteriophage PM2]|uniref:Long tail fiber distal subunit n=1 Tax=Pectobacterium bacteriophage PM2 TaxID=1429794 RepID=A0A0A0Q2I1_9CAUD|nr:long tail fiber protein distal subunit [Pectobacterium bacteriophage PM2]AHY25235.1 long tail fiber distal subunit [Pectobacterium bacteriophage PM2]
MADIKQIQFKRSNTAGARPTSEQIAEGELAINLTDRTLFTKNTLGQVIDLGFAKGGTVVGDINQTGNINSTGNIVAAEILATTRLDSNGPITSNNGRIYSNAPANVDAKVILQGLEIPSSRLRERGSIWAAPQTTTFGSVVISSYNGTNATTASNFIFNGDGDLNVPKNVLATQFKASVQIESPKTVTRQIITSGRATINEFGGNPDYGWNDLVSWPHSETNSINYVYKGRASSSGTIWHQVLDERAGVAEWALYTGVSTSAKNFSVSSIGDGKFRRNLIIGSSSGANYSSLGDNSISIGDVNTGFRRPSLGNLHVLANNSIVAGFSEPDGLNYSYRRLVVQTNNLSNQSVLPENNTAQLRIATFNDNNNFGDGWTHIGYNAGGEYNHYFRGKGEAAFAMGKGVNIATGGLKVTGDSSFVGNVTITGQITPQNYANFDIRYPSYSALSSGINQEIVSRSANAFRSVGARYGFIIRSSGDATHFLSTAIDDPYGTFSSNRPLRIDHITGIVTMEQGLSVLTNVNIGAATYRTDGNILGSNWTSGNLATHISTEDGKRVLKTGDTMSGRLFINQNEGAQLVVNNPEANGPVFIIGRKNQADSFYVGNGNSNSGDVMLHNYVFNNTLTLRQNDTLISKPLLVTGGITSTGGITLGDWTNIDNRINNSSLGVGQTWVNQSRTFNTEYTNDTNKPIMVNVSFSWETNGTIIQFLVDNVVVDTNRIRGFSMSGNFQVIVPKGSKYMITRVSQDISAVIISNWAELR